MVQTEFVVKGALRVVLDNLIQSVRENLKTSSGIATLELACMDPGLADKIIEKSIPKTAYLTIITEEADHE